MGYSKGVRVYSAENLLFLYNWVYNLVFRR